MSTSRAELRALVEALPDEQLSAAVSDLKSRLTERPTTGAWPPAWFGIAEAATQDASERVEEILSEGMGRRGA